MPDTAIAERSEGTVEAAAPQRQSSSSCMAKLDRLRWRSWSWFEIDGFRFGVRSTSLRFGDWVADTLQAYAVDGPKSPSDEFRYSLVVEDERPGERVGHRYHILYLGVWDIVRTFDVETLARSLLHDIESLRFPQRGDAVYLRAGVMRASGATLLVPWVLVPGICKAGRRTQKATNAVLPGTMSVAIDPSTGHLTPVTSALGVNGDSMRTLAKMFGPARTNEHMLVDEELRVDKLLLVDVDAGSGMWPFPRARALYELAAAVKNLDALGGRGFVGLGLMVESAECYEGGFKSTQGMIDLLAAAIGGERYVANRTEATPGEP